MQLEAEKNLFFMYNHKPQITILVILIKDIQKHKILT